MSLLANPLYFTASFEQPAYPCYDTVLLIDVSESMKGDPFTSLKYFVTGILKGIKTETDRIHMVCEEYLAVITKHFAFYIIFYTQQAQQC